MTRRKFSAEEKIRMSVYEHYTPLRKYLRQFPLLESLDVVRAYIQYLQIGQPLGAVAGVVEI